jgi:guanylate kinase
MGKMPLKDTFMFIISGSSGVGKSSVVKGLLARMPDLELSVSCTTRLPRPDDQAGKIYQFMGKDEFQACVEKGDFLEWAFVHGEHYYGTLKSEIERIRASGKIPLLEIEVQGAQILSEQFPNVVTIFIKPESVEELVARIRRRGTMSEEELKNRMHSIQMETAESEKYKYSVVNREGELAKTIQEVTKIIQNYRDHEIGAG